MEKAKEIKDLNQYKQLHAEDPSYGATGLGYFAEVESLIKRLKFSHMIPISAIIDFGCGKGTLMSALNNEESLSIKCVGYDPAVSEYESKPVSKFDMLITTDVLEHVHKDELLGVLGEILAFEPKIMYHSICCAPAGRSRLPDGSNTHKTIENPCWWREQLINKFSEYNVVLLGYNLPGPVSHNANFLVEKR